MSDLNPNRTDYRNARRMIRDNGRHALRWLGGYTRSLMIELIDQRPDPLAQRAADARLLGVSPLRLLRR